MWASVSASSGSMGTNCDDVQQAVQPSHGTSEPCSPRIASCTCWSQAEKSPASSSASSRPSLRSMLGVGPAVGPAVVPVPSHVAAHVLVHGVAITAHACMPSPHVAS